MDKKLLILGIVWLSIGVFGFMTGFNNVDFGWNMKMLEATTGMVITDTNFIITQTMLEGITRGYLMMHIGLFFVACGGFLVGHELGSKE